MRTKFNNVIQLLDYFKSDTKCKQLLIKQRWNDNVCCPFCNTDKVYETNRGYKCANAFCKKNFTVTVGTIFENTKIKLRYWFAAIYLVTSHKKGISSHQLARDLGVTQKTAWFMLHRIRTIMKDKIQAILDGIVEIDETFIGGKSTQSEKFDNKTAVFGMLQRGGKVITKVVKNKSMSILSPIINDTISKGSLIISDGYNGYIGLDKKGYSHESVDHRANEFVRGEFHTNTLEGFWSLFKRGIIGIYHYVSPKHLQKYSDEFAYRYEKRIEKDCDRFINILSNASNFRLTYNQLINL